MQQMITNSIKAKNRNFLTRNSIIWKSFFIEFLGFLINSCRNLITEALLGINDEYPAGEEKENKENVEQNDDVYDFAYYQLGTK